MPAFNYFIHVLTLLYNTKRIVFFTPGWLEGIGAKKCSLLTPKGRKLYPAAKTVLKTYLRSKSCKNLFKSRFASC